MGRHGGFRGLRTILWAALAAGAIALSTVTAVAATAPAGAVLTNQASATFFNTRLGTIETVRSNTVSVEVMAVPGLTVSGSQALTLGRGASGFYFFRAENSGNVPLSTVFEVIEESGDDYDVAGTLLLDADSDGNAGPGDRHIAPGAPIDLAPGQKVTLLYPMVTPGHVTAGQVSRSRLSAKASVSGAVVATGEARSQTTIVESTLSLAKAGILRADAEEIDYTISVRNNAEADIASYAAVSGAAITVDGAPVDAVLVRDLIPLNTHLKSVAPAGGFRAVYHRRGDDEHSYLSAPVDPALEMDAVAFLHDGAYAVGRSSDLGFTVTIVETVEETDIENTALGYITTPAGTVEQTSNDVITPITGPGHRIEFRDPTGQNRVDFTPFDTPFTIHIGAASCNATRAVDRVEVTVSTVYAGDQETLIATETGANTGIFRTEETVIKRVETATQNNTIIEGAPGDAAGAIATAVCLGGTLEATLQVQPGGFVFDSITNEPVVGARVLAFQVAASASGAFRGSSMGEATAALTTTEAGVVSDSLTDESGYFDLGAIPLGDYRIEVTPPSEYRHPSERRVFDGFGRRVDPAISYGTRFSFGGGPISGIDIPVDPTPPVPIALDKTVDRRVVRHGGFVIYTLTARNNLSQALLNAVITDTPPTGFRYIPRSVRLDDASLAEPTVSDDGTLTFLPGTMPPESEMTLTYAMRVGPAARKGNRVNVAILRGEQAGNGMDHASTAARATVLVHNRGGVFTDEAVVVGRVFLDADEDGVQDGAGEPGVPGVKIVTSTGLAVVTDAQGRYSLFGLNARTQVFALVPETLPEGAVPLGGDIGDARAPGSRFVPLRRGEVRGEDFPLRWTVQAAQEIAARLDGEAGLARDRSQLRGDLPLTFDAPGRLSSRNEVARDTTTESGGAAETPEVPRARAEAALPPVEAGIDLLDPAPGFIGIADGDSAGARRLTLRIKAPAEAAPVLEVNGVAAGPDSIGAKAIDRDAGVQVLEYVALTLNAGANRIALKVMDPFGNLRDGAAITVHAPGDPAALDLLVPPQAPADGRARVPVLVRITDAEGRFVRAPAEITLSARKGDWDVRDIREGTPGLQAFVDNGEATFDFIPPDLVGTETITVKTAFAHASADIRIVPDLDERLFVGVVEGAVGFGERGAALNALMEVDQISAFEETVEGARGQLYLKGRIRGDALLTLRYDSDQDTNERLFRDIRADEYYAVYGDNSERGFDAQSAGPLYVKVEKDTSYVLYGDIAVEPQTDAIRLGAWRRSLTGGRARLEHGPVSIDLFVAETAAAQQVVEIEGRGVSGPYDIALGGLVEGSEIVEILVRDRDQPDVILSQERQERLVDYTLDFFADTLIFNRPVPLLDDDLNPVSIRVTYEMEDGAGEDYLVYGGEARVELGPGVAVGYRDVTADAERISEERRRVRSAYVDIDDADWGKASAEVSRTEDRTGRTGYGARFSYAWTGPQMALRVEGAHTQDTFDAPNASVGPGRTEGRVNAEYKLTERVTVGGEALFTRDNRTGDRRFGLTLDTRYKVTDAFELKAGARGTDTDREAGDTEVLSGIVGVAWRPGFMTGLALRAEAEQDVRETDNRRLILGTDYQWSPGLRLYGTNEISTAKAGTFGIGDGADATFTTKVGVEYRLSENLSGFSEYRDDGLSATGGGVANGIRARWQATEVLSFRAGLEHVEPVEDTDIRESAASVGVVYDDADRGLILRADVEADQDRNGRGWYSNVAAAYTLDDDLTVLAQNRLAYDERDEGRLRDRLRLGLAWRPVDNSQIKALGLYEYSIDDHTTREQSHRWSTAVVYDPVERIQLKLKYAGENVDLVTDAFRDNWTLHLLRGGAEVELWRDRLALEGNAMLFTDDDGETVATGLGAELKANLVKNLQIGLGYNHVNIEEERLRDLYHAGWFLRARIKLDGSLWDDFDRLGLTGR